MSAVYDEYREKIAGMVEKVAKASDSWRMRDIALNDIDEMLLNLEDDLEQCDDSDTEKIQDIAELAHLLIVVENELVGLNLPRKD